MININNSIKCSWLNSVNMLAQKVFKQMVVGYNQDYNKIFPLSTSITLVMLIPTQAYVSFKYKITLTLKQFYIVAVVYLFLQWVNYLKVKRLCIRNYNLNSRYRKSIISMRNIYINLRQCKRYLSNNLWHLNNLNSYNYKLKK